MHGIGTKKNLILYLIFEVVLILKQRKVKENIQLSAFVGLSFLQI
jgi:hypothetical protein